MKEERKIDMTRKRYIKKARYLRWRVFQLPENKNTDHSDIYWSIWQKNIPTPSELGCSYDEMWAEVVKAIKIIKGMEDIE